MMKTSMAFGSVATEHDNSSASQLTVGANGSFNFEV